jgi:two-component system, sensor histidine kinase and response regulator
VVALRARQKGLELIVDVAADIPHALRGGTGRLRQILVNLLGNAIMFTADGAIALRVTCETATPPNIALHFSISDTGCSFTTATGCSKPRMSEKGWTRFSPSIRIW